MLEHQQLVSPQFIMRLSRLPALFTHPEKKLQLPKYGKIEMETIPCTGSWLGKDRSSMGRQDKENVLTQKPENRGRKKNSQHLSDIYPPLCYLPIWVFLFKERSSSDLFIYLFLGIKNQRRSRFLCHCDKHQNSLSTNA